MLYCLKGEDDGMRGMDIVLCEIRERDERTFIVLCCVKREDHGRRGLDIVLCCVK